MTDQNDTSRNLVWNTFDEEALILDVASGDYFSLDAIGTQVWKGLNEGHSADEIAAQIAESYGAEVETVKADVIELVEELRTAKLWN